MKSKYPQLLRMIVTSLFIGIQTSLVVESFSGHVTRDLGLIIRPVSSLSPTERPQLLENQRESRRQRSMRYNRLIKSCGRDWVKAIEILKRMGSEKLKADVYAYTSAVS